MEDVGPDLQCAPDHSVTLRHASEPPVDSNIDEFASAVNFRSRAKSCQSCVGLNPAKAGCSRQHRSPLKSRRSRPHQRQRDGTLLTSPQDQPSRDLSVLAAPRCGLTLDHGLDLQFRLQAVTENLTGIVLAMSSLRPNCSVQPSLITGVPSDDD
jgi:hypothetical protein